MTSTFWRGRRVLVTGHTGFKGSWLSLWLQQLGAHVVGYALEPPTNPNLFQIAGVGRGMVSITADIRDLSTLSAAFAQHRPEVVFHLAAQPLVRLSYREPVETYATNVMGTINVLESVRQTDDVRAVVNVTSDKCYENREWWWGYRETEPMGGHDPYSSSKACAELVTAAYRESFFRAADGGAARVAVASARAGNVIGGGDWAADRLVPDIVRAFLAGEPVVLRHPHAIRPWQHVLDSLSGYLLLAERLLTDGAAFAEPWNFGPDDGDVRPVGWVAEQISTAWGRPGSWKMDTGPRDHEATYLKLDNSKAKARLGWRPRWPLDRALAAASHWYLAYQAGDDMAALTLDQLRQYETT